MKTPRPSLLVIFVAGVTAFLISSLHAQTPEQQAVLAPVMALFNGMAKADAEAIRKPLLTGGTMVMESRLR
jgi:hypothetical protein